MSIQLTDDCVENEEERFDDDEAIIDRPRPGQGAAVSKENSNKNHLKGNTGWKENFHLLAKLDNLLRVS